MAQSRTTILLECPKHGVQRETDQPESPFAFLRPRCPTNVAVDGYFYCGHTLVPRRGIVEVLDA